MIEMHNVELIKQITLFFLSNHEDFLQKAYKSICLQTDEMISSI